LARLADRSLLVVVPRDDGTVRYRLLETVRQYAQERLSDRGDAVAIRQQHADFFLAIAESAATELRGPAQVVWLSRLENEHGNLRGALRWCLNNGHIELALRLSGALWWFWWLRGYWHEGRDLLRETLLASTGSSAATRVEALNGAGNLAMASGDYALASEWLTESLALRAGLGDRLGTAGALHNLAHLAREQGNYERAAALYEQSHSLFRAMENKRGIAQTLGALGDMAMIRSDFEVAEACYSESLHIWKSVGSRADVAVPLCDLGLVALQRGDHARAAELLAQSLALFREADDRRGTALALRSLGAVASADGDYERALTFIYEGLARFKEVGDMRGIADSLEELAYAAALGGRAYRAARLYGAVDGLRDALRAPSLSTRRAVHERGAAVARSALKGDVFDAARAAGRALSAEQIVAEVLVDAQPLPASPAPTAELPADPLTPREREVVVLVAQGLTNRQIASALVITERTAENHLGHIFDKLAVASRTQVATWALNRGLIPVAIAPIRR
jgi:DNA-binding CsgD family transcriptional regulator/tetratricopeptide (TPR) repeat protein